MKRASHNETIPEKSEELEITISVRDSKLSKNSAQNSQEARNENELQTEVDINEFNSKNMGQNKLLINVDVKVEKKETYNKPKINQHIKEETPINKFNSDNPNREVESLPKIYDIEKKKNANFNMVISNISKEKLHHKIDIIRKYSNEKINKTFNASIGKNRNMSVDNVLSNFHRTDKTAMSRVHDESEKFISTQSITNTEKMRFKELWNYFSSLDLSEEKNSVKVEDFSKYNCLNLIYLKCTKKLVLDNELLDERQLIVSLTKIPLNFKDEIHIRTMTTIYQNISRELDCPLKGDHWMKLGFQSSDPKNDMRSTGMFSMLQILAFMDRFHNYVVEIFEYIGSEFKFNSFACILINMSYYSIQALREGILIPFCNKYQSVISCVNDFYIGMVNLFIEQRKSNKIVNDNINDVIKTLAKFSKSNPQIVFDQIEILKKKYPQAHKDSMSLGEEINKYC